MIGALREMLDARQTNADGVPLCTCGALLAVDELACAVCRSAARDRSLRDEAERELREARQRAVDRLPRWGWVDSDADFAAKVTHRRLRGVADRYRLTDGNLLVLGAPGIGKTASIIRALRRLVMEAAPRDRVLRVVWTTGPELVAAQAQHRLGTEAPSAIRSAKRAPVLVIDELGFEARAPAGFWLELMNARYEAGLITITSSGATAKHLSDTERYGAGVYRRLLAGGALLDLWPP